MQTIDLDGPDGEAMAMMAPLRNEYPYNLERTLSPSLLI